MEISRERFLDDSRTYHMTIGIRSRTTAAHSLLSALTPDEKEQVSAAIVKAMDQIEKIVRSHILSSGGSE
jgi:peptidyl-tRNA hydrolase